MKKYYNSYFDETYYLDTLSNGMKVTIFYKPEFLNTTCAIGVPYGGLMINQKFNNKNYSFNPGVAHFLEHKLFEAKGDDIMNAFSALGANVNAFTSYKETVYYFSKSSKDIEKPLNLLLDFVMNLQISKESVEKEKGIIIQEVSMYDQMPDQRLLRKTYESLYKYYPLKYDIGGNEKSIKAITKEELEECYKLNYHPSNMSLVITSPVNPESIIKIIKSNQSKYKFKKVKTPLVNDKVEPKEVVRKRTIFTMPIESNKHLLAFKLKPNFIDNNDAFIKELCIRFLFEAHFSSLNPKYQEWLDHKIINDYFGYEVDFDFNYANIMFYIENDDSKVLKKLITNSLKDDLLTEDLLKQIKRRFIGEMFTVFNDVESFDLGYIRDCLNGIDFFKVISAIQRISLKDVKKVWKSLDLSNYSYISMIKK